MARAGVTYDEVAQVATLLTEQGKSLTIEAVRGVLNTGSNTTLSKHLNQWRQHHRGVTQSEQGLPETLINAVKGLHQAMTAEANAKVEQLELNHAEAINALKAELEALQQQHNQALKTNRSLEQDKSQLTEEKAALERHIEAQKQVNNQQSQEIHLLSERLNDKKSDIENYHQQIQHAQANLEHYREATRAEREQERLSYESKLTQLEQALRESQTLAVKTRAELDFFQNKNKELEAQLATQTELSHTSEQKMRELELELQKQKASHTQLSREFATLQEQKAQWMTQAETDKVTLQEFMLQKERDREKIHSLETALTKAEDRITMLTDKNLFLAQEKAELVIKADSLIQMNAVAKN